MIASPLVSIALATYNGETFLAQQLDSLLAQDYANLEIVISDDCSTDRTWEILCAYAAKDRRLRLLPRETNRGYVRNFIRAFAACGGEFISPCDQDDIWHPEKTRRLMENIGDASLIYCDSRFVDESGRYKGRRLSDTIQMVSGDDSRKLLFCTSICGHAMLFRASLLKATDRLDLAPYIDWMVAFLAMEHGRVSYLDEPLVDWRQHTESLSSHVRMASRKSRIKTLESDEKLIEALSSISTKNQSFAVDAFRKWKRWRHSYFSLDMFFFVRKYGHITHAAHVSKTPALKYLLGCRLKKLLAPGRY